MRRRAKDAFVDVRRLVRFGGVGIVSLLVYSSLYTLLAEATHLGAVPTSVIAYAIAMVVSFVGHKYFTFGVFEDLRAQIFKFVVMHCICLLMTVMITALVVDTLRWPYGVAILLVDVVIPLLSFLALKLVVFEEKSSARPLSKAPDAEGYRQ